MNNLLIFFIIIVVLGAVGVALWLYLRPSSPQQATKTGVSAILEHLTVGDQAGCLASGCSGKNQTCYGGTCCNAKSFLGGLVEYLESGGIKGFMIDNMRTKNTAGVAPVDVITFNTNENIGVMEVHVRLQFYLSPYFGIPGDMGGDCDHDTGTCDGFTDPDSNGCTFTASKACDIITECSDDISHCVGNPDVCIPWTSKSDGCPCVCKQSPTVITEPTWEIVELIAYPATTDQQASGYGAIIAATMSLENFAMWGYITGNSSNGYGGDGMHFRGTVTAEFPNDNGIGMTFAINTNPSKGLLKILKVGMNSGAVKVNTSGIQWENTGDLGGSIEDQITDGLQDSMSDSITTQLREFRYTDILPPSDLEPIIDSAIADAVSEKNVVSFFNAFILPINVTIPLDVVGDVTIAIDPDTIPQITALPTTIDSQITVGVSFDTATDVTITQVSSGKDACGLLSLTSQSCNQIPAGTTLSWTVSLDGTAANKPQPFWVVLTEFTVDTPTDTLMTDVFSSAEVASGIQASFDLLMTAFYACQPVSKARECSDLKDCGWPYACVSSMCVCANDKCPRQCEASSECDTYYSDYAVSSKYILDPRDGGFMMEVVPKIEQNDTITTTCNEAGLCGGNSGSPTTTCSADNDCLLLAKDASGGIMQSSVSDSVRLGNILTAIPQEAVSEGDVWVAHCDSGKCRMTFPGI